MSVREPRTPDSPGAEWTQEVKQGRRRKSPAVIRVAQVGPHHGIGGGMPYVIGSLLRSPLAVSYRFDAIPTWDGRRPVRRLAVFALALARLTRWCLGRGVRVVHVHSAVRGSLYRKSVCVLLARTLGRPVLLHVHAGPGDIIAFHERTGRVRRAAFRGALRRASRVVAVSRASADELGSRFGIEDISPLPNAAPPAVPVAASAREGVEVLFLGGFANGIKGGEGLVSALPEVLRAAPHVTVNLAGPGEAPAALRELMSESDAVRWAGWLDDRAKADAFTRSSIFVLPSESEGLPIALLEAMAYGSGIVATRVGGVPEVITDCENGLLVEPGSPAELAAAIVRLASDESLRARLGAAARDGAEYLNSEVVYARLDEIYRSLAA